MTDVVALTDSFVPSLPKGWNAAVRIKQADGTTDATVYKDPNGVSTGANPLPHGNGSYGIDGSGGWLVYVPAGDYVVSVTPHGGSEHHASVTVAADVGTQPAQDDLLPSPAGEGDAGKVVTVNDAGTGFELATPEAGGGDGGSEHLGDYARWAHTGAVDGTTGSIDFAADLADSSGSTITTDAASDWTDSWGYAVPMVTEAGCYLIEFRAVSSSAQCDAKLDLLANADGDTPPPFDTADPFQANATKDHNNHWIAKMRSTVYLAAGTHFDFNGISSGSTLSNLDLLIQRVA